MAEELLQGYGEGIDSLALIPSGGGRFEVMVNGRLIFSKAKEGRFPDLREIHEGVNQLIEEQA
jgi:selenoprotein W-related protein